MNLECIDLQGECRCGIILLEAFGSPDGTASAFYNPIVGTYGTQVLIE